ncbi:hypothetical protein AG1IA_03422 [Rhizoctonia solani AG-1 IA]|uniref:Uncharacterized protein n=1 Tax=Thanatephorus cucumeris (strain AG1-IA) TaxID=983506 RepID=L8X0C9_THACA|nr:hypothetical protein AG1IA_03422 [Rhizoctonia solani AG-1 IA]
MPCFSSELCFGQAHAPCLLVVLSCDSLLILIQTTFLSLFPACQSPILYPHTHLFHSQACAVCMQRLKPPCPPSNRCALTLCHFLATTS